MHNHPTAYQPRSKLKQVFLLIGALVVLSALAGGYYAYWRYVAQQLQAGVEAWATEQRTLGNDVAFTWNGIGGFPLRFEATFQDPAIRWRGPREEGTWTGVTLHAEMAPWNLRRIEVRSDGQHDASLRLAGDAAEWRLAATGFAGAIDLHGSGQLRGFTLALQQPDVAMPDGTVLASAAATVMLDQPETPPTDFNMPLARVTLDLRGLALPPGTRLLTEDAVETLSFDATIKGAMPLAPLREALAAWRDAGGVVELNSFAFAQGPLGVTGNATRGAGCGVAAGRSGEHHDHRPQRGGGDPDQGRPRPGRPRPDRAHHRQGAGETGAGRQVAGDRRLVAAEPHGQLRAGAAVRAATDRVALG